MRSMTWQLAQAENGADFGEGLALMVVGMGAVFVLLVIIGLVVLGMRKVLDRPTVAAIREQSAVPDQIPTGMSPERIAVISAAAMAALGKPVRVHRVVMLGAGGTTPWVAGGRATVMGSHSPFNPAGRRT